MSIVVAVTKLVSARRLIDRPSTFMESRARELYVTPEIDGYAAPPFADTREGERFAEMATYFDEFCELTMVTVSEDPFNKPPDVMMARVHPIADEFWSMRVTDPEDTSGIRVLGGFCAKDAFVALMWDFRENIGDNFDEEVDELKAIWRDYFGDLSPYTGSSLDDYLTNYDAS